MQSKYLIGGAAVAMVAGLCLNSGASAQNAPPSVSPPASLQPGAPMDSDNGSGGQPMQQDHAISMNGIEVACTGTGSAKDDPQWQSWPIRIVFSNGGAQFLSGVHVTISHNGQTMADGVCDAPWVLMRGPSGTYQVTAALTGHEGSSHTATFSPPSHGQRRVEIQFPGMGANQ